MTKDLSVEIGSLRLSNPLIAASGCYGYGVEYADAVDLSSLGAVVSKGLFLAPREGHPPPRIVETPSGMLNAIGLQGIGVHRYIAEKLPELRRLRATNIINICGSTLDEYVELARILSDAEGEQVEEEGCLSIPGPFHPTARAARIVCRGQDLAGDPLEVVGEGLLARILQHETDHVDGLLFIDRLDEGARREVLAELRRIDLGEVTGRRRRSD